MRNKNNCQMHIIVVDMEDDDDDDDDDMPSSETYTTNIYIQ